MKNTPVGPHAARYETPAKRNIALWVGFLLACAIAVWTVLIPELRDDRQDDQESDSPAQTPSEP